MKQTKRLLALLLVMAMVMVNVPLPVFAVRTTNADGYIEVRTIEDLYNIRDDLTANYILMNDIDLTDATAKGGDWDFGGRGWNPIGSNDTYSTSYPFSGVFDGNGYAIIGMRIECSLHAHGGYFGLFSGISGTVKNLTMLGGSIIVERVSSSAGSIAGSLLSTGTIENCKNSANVTTNIGYGDYGYAGGIVGRGSGTIRFCVNSGSIKSVHINYGGSSSNDECIAGGIVGYGSPTIEYSYNLGTIYAALSTYTKYGKIKAAGISASGNVSYCYNAGQVTGNGNGISCGQVTQCYNVGAATYGIGQDSVNKQCYYLSGASTKADGATPLTESQMRTQSMYKGYDFENVWVINPYANYPYPQLRNNVQDMSESASLVSIISLPAKTDYFVGDELDFTGAMVKVVFVSGKEEIIGITDDIVSDVDMNTAGQKTITVTVSGKSDSYTINVAQRPVVDSVSIMMQPDQKVFAVGTTFDFTGAMAKISYAGGITEYKEITVEATTGGNINHIGKQTITYTFEGQSATFEVEVVGIALDKIVLSKLPQKLTYLEGHELDLTGLAITAVMNNGMESAVGSGYTVSGYSSEPGTHTITVTYLGKTASFQVTVAKKQLVSLGINMLPDKLEYISGQPFDATGMQVIATYDNGDVAVVEDYTVSGFDNVPGIKNVVISLEGKSVFFPVKVIARVITDFQLVSAPAKLEYIENETFDPTGLEVEATYNDGVTETVTEYDLIGFSSKPGVHTVTVAYEGFVRSFQIHVIPRVLENIRVITPNKVTYFIGEIFDPAGMEVIACYNNGQEIAVDDYKVSGFESSAPGAKIIEVTYGGLTRTFVVVIEERSVIEANGSFIVDDLVGRLGEEIRVPVTVTSNTGIAGLRHEISFETTNLKFVGAEMKSDYEKGTLIVNSEKADQGQVSVVWFCSYDVKSSGTVYELIFEVQETAADGITEVKIDFADNDHGNVSGENVLFGKQDGSVEVRSWWLGDLNGDRKYAMVDLVMLAQYVAGFEMTMTEKQLLSADVNEDGSIDIHDVILLNQWLLTEDF